eukprot:GILJ01006643.1.p1 GENE.GILJ01006643.1~~GILJ01006643.1.p1  ORF type:complete len:1057 (+),score=103.81 GILJ01006643.1:402-3173(+)
MPILHSLVLSDNKIVSLPVEFGNLSRMRVLHLNNNEFSAIPTSIHKMLSLREISLEWFRYVEPPLPRVLRGPEHTVNIESFRRLCHAVAQKGFQQCSLVSVLKNLSKSTNFDVNRRDLHRRTLMYLAASEGCLGIVKGLLEAGAEVNICDRDGYTPLLVAVRENQAEAVHLLVKHGADVNVGAGGLGTPLLFAVSAMDVNMVNCFLQAGADVRLKDADGNTPLHLVLNSFDKDPVSSAAIMEALVDHNASVNVTNGEKWAPLHLAARKGQVRGVQWVVNKNKQSRAQGLEQFDLDLAGGSHLWTALHLAGHAGHHAVIETLVDAGADVFIRTYDGRLPRHVSRGHVAVTKIFRKIERFWLRDRVVVEGRVPERRTTAHVLSGPSIAQRNYSSGQPGQPRQRRSWETVPIFRADSLPNPDVPLHLIRSAPQSDNGFNEQHNGSVQSHNRSPLYESLCSVAHTSLVHIMSTLSCDERFSEQALLEHVDEEGYSPLHWACWAGDEDAVRYILSKRIAVDLTQKEDGRTLLHFLATLEMRDHPSRKLSMPVPDKLLRTSIASFLLTLSRVQSGVETVHSRSLSMSRKARHSLAAYGDIDFVMQRGVRSVVVEPSVESFHTDTSEHDTIVTDTSPIYSRGRSCPQTLDIDARDVCGRTALHLACESGNVDLVRLLLANGADPNVCEASTAWSPLHFAVSKGHHAIVLQLLADKRCQVELFDRFMWTPLYEAAHNRDARAVGLLVNHGALLNRVNDQGNSPIHAVIASKLADAEKVWMISLLVCNGALLSSVAPLPDHMMSQVRAAVDVAQTIKVSQSFPMFYVPDNLAPNCMKCDALFSVSIRRHHCRWCGIVICAGCSGANGSATPSKAQNGESKHKKQQKAPRTKKSKLCADCAAFVLSFKHASPPLTLAQRQKQILTSELGGFEV